MIKAGDVNYARGIDTEWASAINEAETLVDLQGIANVFQRFAWDAKVKIGTFSDEDFGEFRDVLKKERSGEWAGEDAAIKFADILMPEFMFKVSMYAIQYTVPWGLMFRRMLEAGQAGMKDGRYQFTEQSQ